MPLPRPEPSRRGRSARAGRAPVPLGLSALALLAAGCGGGGGAGGGFDPIGELVAKPDGSGFYIADPHHSGGLSRLHLVEITWGRLVDVHALDEQGAVLPDPLLRDFLINENVQTDADRYQLDTNPITQKTRLVIRRVLGAPEAGQGTFESLLREAALGLPGVIPKSDLPTESTPFSFVARNCALMLRFDDLLADDEQAALDLSRALRLLTGYPPGRPSEPRILFDANHGGVSGARFHSTRVLVDLTVSEAEAADSQLPLPLNSLGFPASDFTSERANVALRLPTREASGAGVFVLLRNLSGSPLDERGNGPIDLASPAHELVRAMRAGNERDPNNGFLLDFLAPRVVGTWPCLVTAARPLPSSPSDWVLDLLFTTTCRKTPEASDILASGELLLEVVRDGGAPDVEGRVSDLPVRVLGSTPPAGSGALLGAASYLSTYRPGERLAAGCWVRFTPEPRTPPDLGISPLARITVRFSEALDPDSVRAFDTLQLVRGDRSTPPSATGLVVGSIQPSFDLRAYTFAPSLPLAHAGESALYHLELPTAGGVTDLAGNELAEALPAIEFCIDPSAPPANNGGFVLRFGSNDELEPLGAPDLRGQFTYDFDRTVIRPRPASFVSAPVDRTVPLVSIMTPFAPGVATPLSPLGSKLQMVWRYADLGWSIRDENRYNLDVIGLSWSPARGLVVSDFFELFEMRLCHARRLPDEARRNASNGLPRYPASGLFAGPTPYIENILDDPLSLQRIVHERSLGYRVSPTDLTLAAGGTPLLPFPMNRSGGTRSSFTWRDTAVLAVGGEDGAGVPLDIEVGPPLSLETQIGSFAPVGKVPSVGLPLLLEIRCFPSQSAIGLNPLAINLASNTSSAPNFRAYSTGGINTAGMPVAKNPDLEIAPTGGFNPNSRPPGKRTRLTADNALYLGQLDYVVRISRVHSIWIDTKAPAPRYVPPVVEPTADAFPSGTGIALEFRGADGFLDADARPFNAASLTPYGDVRAGTILFHGGDPTWRDLTALEGARYFQFRITFVNNIDALLSPELSAIGLAYEIP